MAYSGYNGGSSHSCRSYCNVSGYYNAGFSCAGQFCCGSTYVRFCCSNQSLDISNAYPEKCRCAMSSCTYVSWDVLLPCIAAALFILLMVTICCCHGCRSCVRCRQVIRRQCLPTNSATVSNGPGGLPENLEEEQRTAGDSTFPNLPPYEFAPPKYESLELTEAPPKYEEVVTQGESEAHVNSAFADDNDTHDCVVVTDESHSHDAIVPGTSGTLQGQNQSRTSDDGHVTTNSKVPSLLHTDGSCQRLQAIHLSESSLTQSPPSHELTPSAGDEVSTSPSQEASIPSQVRGIPVDSNRVISQVLELADCEERTQEHRV